MRSYPALKRFAARVRLVRGWVGLSIGLSIGAALAAIWSALDWFGILYAEWATLGILVGACGVLGLVLGALWGISPKGLADSIDRRAQLQDRLTTASERTEAHGAFDDALRQDASDHLKDLRPAKLYPIRVSRWHGGAVVLSVVAASIFLLGNSPLLLNKDAKAARTKMQEQAAQIDRVLKPLEEEAKKGELSEAEKKLAQDLRKLSQDLHKAHIDPEKALQKQNELNEQAKKLADQRFQKADQSMQTAQSAFEKMQAEQKDKMQQMDMSKSGLTQAEVEKAKADLAKMSPKDIQKAMDLMKQKDTLESKLNDPNLTKEERDALEQQLQDVTKQLAQMHLSDEVMKMFERMTKDPLWKEIMKKMAELAKQQQELQKLLDTSKKMGKGQGKSPQLTQEQMDAMAKQLEEMAKALSTDEAMHQYLQAMLDALKNGKMGLGLMPGPGLPMPMPGPGMATPDFYFANTGKIFKGNGEKSQGTTSLTAIRGQSRDVPGQNAYIEMRGPSTTGLRSSIPYQKVLPSYKHKADEAMNRQEIPAQHQKRVKKYFESLGQ